MSENQTRYQGGCLCGVVRYTVSGELDDPHLCHCDMCQRQSGYCVAGAGARRADLDVTGEENVTWFQSSSFAKRGFCKICGSKLFWDDGSEWVGLNMGSLDQPTGLKIARHVFVDDASDYYEIADGKPKAEARDPDLTTMVSDQE